MSPRLQLTLWKAFCQASHVVPVAVRSPHAPARSVALVAVLSGCADDPRGAESTVGVRAGGCESIERIGTGVVVETTEGPVVVTSAHTVTGADSVIVVTDDEHEAELLAFDPTTDLALLTAPAGPPAAQLATEIDQGESARLVVWEPDGRLIETDAEVSRLLKVTIEDIFVEAEVERRAFEIDVSTRRGDSGGPVFAEDGDVLGVIYARSRERDVSFAVRYEQIATLIEAPTIPESAARCR